MNSEKIISLIAVGAAIGTGIGILCTDKGKDLTKKVSEGSNKYADKMKEGIVNFLFVLIDTFTSKAKNQTDEIEEAIAGRA